LSNDKNDNKGATKLAKMRADARGDLGVSLSGSASTGHEVNLLREGALPAIFGASDSEQAAAFLSHCLKVLRPEEAGDRGEANDERHFMLSIIRDIGPRDPVESMLAVQMAATHVATIRAAGWLANGKGLLQTQAYFTGYNKLARTFAAQIEALRKHRNGGKQTVIVQHVNVAEGGQAIVGHVQTGGRVPDGK
jgi:hypothetical protein